MSTARIQRALGVLTFLGAFAAASLATTRAHAETLWLGAHVGGTGITRGSETTWHPNLRAELGVELTGPLYLGGMLRGIASDLPFDNAGFGGGGFLAFRPGLLGFNLHLEASVARLAIPIANDTAGVWELGLAGGIGVPLAPLLGLEVRLGYGKLLGAPDGVDAGTDNISITGGLTISIP